MINKTLVQITQMMVKVDQGARFQARGSKGNLPPNLLIYAIDAAHSHRMRMLILEYGYPTRKLLGAKGMKDWWLLVQHQDLDPELQKKCLKHCDFAPEERAMLVDRVLVGEGKQQRYGTQLKRNPEGEMVLVDIEDPQKVDARRKEMGLEPLKVYIAKVRGIASQQQKQNRK